MSSSNFLKNANRVIAIPSKKVKKMVNGKEAEVQLYKIKPMRKGMV